MLRPPPTSSFFFFNDTATTEIYTLSLHDALPISAKVLAFCGLKVIKIARPKAANILPKAAMVIKLCDRPDRKSTRLNSSHLVISYAVFCLKKKKKEKNVL